MDTEKILKLFNPKDKQRLRSFIYQKIVTEKQLLQIARNTFKIKETNHSSINKIQAQKMLLSLAFVINSDIQKIDPKGFENYIKRLIKGGINEAKEVWAHNFLSKSFSDYHLTIPFLGHGQTSSPDGFIKDDSDEVPVEIKVRTPEILGTLDDFFKFIGDSVEGVFSGKKVVICNIILQRINKFDQTVIEEEKHDLPTVINKIKQIDIPSHPYVFSAKRESKNIEWKMEITSIDQKPQDSFFMPKKLVDDCIAYKGLTSVYNGSFFGGTHLVLTCSDETKKLLSEKLITQCFRNSKNLPKSGLIVIFTDTLINEYLNKYYEDTARKCIGKKANQAILGLQGRFNQEKMQLIGRILGMGDGIKKFIQKKSPQLFDKF